jgi:hypothetical protein
MTEITQIPVTRIPVPDMDAVLEMHLAIGWASGSRPRRGP